jgi:hypothetical protein
MSFALIVAWSCVALTTVVGRFVPFHRTTDELMKALPFTVNVKEAPPASALLGESELTTGAGLFDESTVTVGLVARRTEFTKRRNSYVPAVVGIVVVHVLVVTPDPTNVH